MEIYTGLPFLRHPLSTLAAATTYPQPKNHYIKIA
jgi:hypothetical protein